MLRVRCTSRVAPASSARPLVPPIRTRARASTRVLAWRPPPRPRGRAVLRRGVHAGPDRDGASGGARLLNGLPATALGPHVAGIGRPLVSRVGDVLLPHG